jgi:acyl CoA:acetate/3-ketoacid CoA transferase beta subunit
MALSDFTYDELMIACMAREVRNGDLAIQGLTTPMAIIAYYLARATHAPDASIMQLAGNILIHSDEPPRVSILYNELRAMRTAVHFGPQTEVYEAIFKKAKSIVEFFRPAQIDMHGNSNNSFIGREKSRLKLPGGFGIPDVSAIYPRTLYYCPRHEKRVFVEHVDHVGGLGLNKGEVPESHREIHVVSELGVFKVEPEMTRMIVSSIHPGVDLEQIKENTGFEMLVPGAVPTTDPPTDLELELIREKIDPLNIRRLELLAGEERTKALLELLEKELATPR